jgi:predicted tellurium resistance membrane protein TerC
MILLYDPGSMFAKDNLLFIVLISKRLEIEQQEDSSKVGCWLRTQVTG